MATFLLVTSGLICLCFAYYSQAVQIEAKYDYVRDFILNFLDRQDINEVTPHYLSSLLSHGWKKYSWGFVYNICIDMQHQGLLVAKIVATDNRKVEVFCLPHKQNS